MRTLVMMALGLGILALGGFLGSVAIGGLGTGTLFIEPPEGTSQRAEQPLIFWLLFGFTCLTALVSAATGFLLLRSALSGRFNAPPPLE